VDRSQLDEGKVVCRKLFITGRDPSALLDLVDELLNKVAPVSELESRLSRRLQGQTAMSGMTQ
jgi:hypothetical protein